MKAGAFATLTKLPISLLSALSAAAGHIAFARTVHPGIVPAVLGILILAMGGSALNEWEEREIDARMERTRLRPIPSGKIAPRTGLAIGLGLSAAGFGVLTALSGWAAAALGLLALVWYIAVYTPLKRRTAFAWLPGALIGAIPPALGWLAAGGSLLDRGALAIPAFFFIWQIPHFWLLLAARGREYEAAGLPCLTGVLGPRQIARLTFIWTLSSAASSLLLPIYGVVASPLAVLGLAAAAMGSAAIAGKALRAPLDPAALRLAFRGINLHALAVIALVAIDALAV